MKTIGNIVAGSIKNQKMVRFIFLLLIVSGILALVFIRKAEFPVYQIKQGLIVAVYPGADVNQVEQEVAKPLENMLLQMKEIDREYLDVNCKDGMCYIVLNLNVNVASSECTQVWSKMRLQLEEFKALSLPPGVLAVVLMDDFSNVSSLLIAMESDDKGWTEMNEYAEDLAARLRKLPELANARILGEQEEEIAVTMDMDKLSAYGVSPTQIMLNYGSGTIQALGGTFNTDYISAPVYVPSTVTTEQELENHIVFSTPDNKALRLRDIAKVERRYREPSSLVEYNGHTALILSIEALQNYDIVTFGKKVDEVLQDFSKDLPESVKVSRIIDMPKVVGRSVWGFLRDLLISMLVVIAVMLLLFPMKSALIASSGLPVCTAVAIALMYLTGIDLNICSLAALIVVLGMIVDDSVITMDGYMDKLGRGLSRKDAACKSAEELFFPMFTATLSISLMFLPMTRIIKGYLGDFVQTFPWVILFSLLTSLLYAILMVPSLEVRFIHSARIESDNAMSRMQKKLFSFLQNGYEKCLDWCMLNPVKTIAGAVASILLGAFLFTRINVQMMPMAPRPYFAVEVYLDPSAGIEDTQAVCDSLSTLLRQDKRIKSVTEFIGTSAPRFHAPYIPVFPGKNMAQLIVNTTSDMATETYLHDFETLYEHRFPQARLHFKQMDYQGTSEPVKVRVMGDNDEDVFIVSEKIREHMLGMQSLKWVHSDADDFCSCVNVNLDSEQAASLGVNRTVMNLSLASQMGGTKIATIREEGRDVPVYLYNANYTEDSPYEQIANTLVPGLPGMNVPVRQVAKVTPDWKPGCLHRYQSKRTIVVGADMKYAQSQPAASKEIKRFVKEDLELPEGVTIKYGGLDSINGEVMPQIVLSFIAAVLVLFLFLLIHFKKMSISLLTMSMGLLCVFGASLGLLIFRLDFSLTATLGLISLVGIIVRNGIIMYDYAETLRLEQGMSAKDAAYKAGCRRMRPIFLTSVTTALGVLPMIIIGDTLWQPMGVSICFGTLLTIFILTLVMPISYWQAFKNSEVKKEELQ